MLLRLLYLGFVLGLGVAVRGQQSQADVAAPASAVAVTKGDYSLAAQDVVKITVFREDDLTTVARIGGDGVVHFPLIGAVRIGGKTVRQAIAVIEEELKKDYFVAPQVSVTVTEFAKHRFSILGQVKTPGTYELLAHTEVDLIQAIAMAGGYTRSANPSKIIVKRALAGEERIIRVNGKDLTRDGKTKSFAVLPGDTIVVAENFF